MEKEKWYAKFHIEEWIEKESRGNPAKKYYFNQRTGERTWVRPVELPVVRSKRQREPGVAVSSSSSSASASAPLDSFNPATDQSGQHADLAAFSKVDIHQIITAGMTASSTGPLQPPVFVAEHPQSAVKDMYHRRDLQVNSHLAKAYEDGYVTDSKGAQHKFKDITNPLQGKHLYNIVNDNKFTRTLEVGFAMGASASWITTAHKNLGLNGKHFALDPNQTLQYEGIGRWLVEQCGNKDHLEVIELTSYRAFPLLLEQVLSGTLPKFHLIYIDGWHTFDYTLLDFFYADLLLEENGVIVLDDILHKPVASAFDYIRLNYLHFRLVEKTPCFDPTNPEIKSSQATFVKIGVDKRPWNAHVDFCGSGSEIRSGSGVGWRPTKTSSTGGGGGGGRGEEGPPHSDVVTEPNPPAGRGVRSGGGGGGGDGRPSKHPAISGGRK